MSIRFLILFSAVSCATSFSTRSVIAFHPAKAASHVVLFEIDEKSVTDAVSVNQIPKEAPVAKSPAPAPTPTPTKAIETKTSLLTESADMVPTKSSPVSPGTWSNPSTPSGDLPLPLIGGGLLAAFAAATFAMRGRTEVNSPIGATSSINDVSIPYDAAARFAYESSDKSMPYDDFKTKYEADAVAEVIAKQK